MPSFPAPGSVTICEINRELIISDRISDDLATSTYGKILGKVFSPVQFQPESVVLTGSDQGTEEQISNIDGEGAPTGGIVASFQGFINSTVKRLFSPNDVNLLPAVDLQGVSWHKQKHIIAFISGKSQVFIRDYDDAGFSGVINNEVIDFSFVQQYSKDPCILTHELQRGIKVLEWRPNSGRMLAVGCKGGICIWAASFPGNAALIRSGITSFVGSLSKGSGIRYTLVDFLRSPNDELISSLSWSHDGRYLASASCESSSFIIWDVARGLPTPIRRGLGAVSTVKWSPSGDYFFAGKFDSTFYLWETNTWTSEQWSSSSGFVTGAIWDPDGHMILLAFSESSTLGSIHFASKPPSLDAHLLPVDLPELVSCHDIEKMAWDGSGERFAVSFESKDEAYKGLIAIYDVRKTPLISASLIGFVRGPGDSPKPLAFSFHNKFKEGPLLSVCWSSGFCCTYPLIFRSHVQP